MARQRLDISRSVGTAIRVSRQSRGLSQEALAELAKLHRTYIGSVERGERNLTLNSLEAIATALSMTPSLLLAKAESMSAEGTRRRTN
jgi:transcriptional regulator with XRE-family HTH domain